MEGPGRRTSEPVPKETTGKGDAAVERRRWASIDRFWFEAHTVQNLSLYESDEVAGVTSAGWDSRPLSLAVSAQALSGGGGGGGGGVAVPVCARRGSWAMMIYVKIDRMWDGKLKGITRVDTRNTESGRLENVFTIS